MLINFISDNEEFKILIGTYYNENDIEIYSINSNKFNEANNVLMQDKVKIEIFKDTYIKANVNNKSNNTIYTSIPYDDEIKVYVDGKKVNTFMIGDALLGFDIESGKHVIEIKYKNNLMLIGSVISLSTLIVIIQLKRKCT